MLDPQQFMLMTGQEVMARLNGLVACESKTKSNDRRIKGLKGFDSRIKAKLVYKGRGAVRRETSGDGAP